VYSVCFCWLFLCLIAYTHADEHTPYTRSTDNHSPTRLMLSELALFFPPLSLYFFLYFWLFLFGEWKCWITPQFGKCLGKLIHTPAYTHTCTYTQYTHTQFMGTQVASVVHVCHFLEKVPCMQYCSNGFCGNKFEFYVCDICTVFWLLAHFYTRIFIVDCNLVLTTMYIVAISFADWPF
jgi:hypothetical protein